MTQPFQIPTEFEQEYYNAPVVTVSEALASKRNRRVSLKGIKNVVTDVFNNKVSVDATAETSVSVSSGYIM